MLVCPAAQAHSVRIWQSSWLPLRVLPERCRPADSLLPGHNPAHDARCAAVGNRDISTPISEMMTWAERSPIQDRRQQRPLLGEREGGLLDPGVQAGDHVREMVDVF